MAEHSKWVIDPGHSEAQVKVRHLAISNVTGKFKVFQGDLVCDNADFNDASIRVTLDSGSLDTNNPQRDAHLVSPDFLYAEKYPVIAFTGVLQKAGSDYLLTGELSIREVKRHVSLNAGLNGIATGRFGDTRAGFEVRGKINRKDFGLTWNILAEGGGLVVGDEIDLYFDIQLIRQ